MRFYKIVKVKRHVNKNVMIRKLKFLYKSNKRFYARCLKRRLCLLQKSPALKWNLIYCLKGMETRILMFWKMEVSQNVRFFLQTLFSVMNIQSLCQCWFINRSSRSQMFYKMDVFKNVAKFTRKHQLQGFFFNKIAVFRSKIYLKKRLRHSCFAVNV